MSLILDALNRADKERSEEQCTPSLHANYNPEVQHKQPIRRWAIEGVVMVAVIALAVGGFIYSQQGNEKSQDKNTARQKLIPAAPIAPVVIPALEAQPVTPLAKDTAIDTITPATVAVLQAESSGQNQPRNADIQSLYEQQSQPQPAPATIQKKPLTPKVSEITTTAVDEGLAILQQIPLLVQMSPRFQNAIPNIDYEVHVYAESNNVGFVRLNGKIMKIGADVIPGLKVIAILQDSLVLDYKGTQFRLLALNSWMNFN